MKGTILIRQPASLELALAEAKTQVLHEADYTWVARWQETICGIPDVLVWYSREE